MDSTLENVNFFGTDGIRGKTDTVSLTWMDALKLFRKSAVITPSLIELAVLSFTTLIGGTAASTYVTGSDGRDAVNDNAFVRAMDNAFAAGGATVYSLGTVPTPAVPQYQLLHGCRGAAMLTASHNPSNQNGIKFFVNGKKLLPEGEISDIRLSRIMYEKALAASKSGSSPVSGKSSSTGPVVQAEPANMILDTLEKNIPYSRMKGMNFILDTAAGAWTRYADAFFAGHGLCCRRISEDEKGYNINRNCGVAEIEGHEKYTRAQIPYSPAIVRTLFENPSSYGIVTDGDGDRGMLLKYDAAADCVRVYDGDEEAYLILGLLDRSGRLAPASTIVCTLESDIMASVSFAGRFGCRSLITDVGDKWICNCADPALSIGFESSGHVIIPMPLQNGQTLLSGNGLLTAALTALALEEGLESFERGFSGTYYTYFVDKHLFAEGTALFDEDASMLSAALGSALASAPAAIRDGLTFERRFFKDRNVLSCAVLKDGMTVALIVSRNSGTEDKNAVYLKCVPSLTDVLRPVAEALTARHRQAMRNADRPETAVARTILNAIASTGRFALTEEQKKDPLTTSVLHALERERQIKGDGTVFVSF